MNQRISYIKKKNLRRLLASVLFLTLTLTALTACSKNDADTGSRNNGKDSTGANGSSGGTSAKGRYIEDDMDLPLADGEEVLNLTRITDDAPVLFTRVNDTQVNRYEYNGKDWSKTALDWLARVYPDSEVIPMEVQETAEGVQYVRGMDEEQTHIARGGNGQEGEELQIPYLAEQAEIGYPIITGMLVDDAGNYWLQSPYEGTAAVIAGDTLEVLEELPTSQLLSMMDRLIFQGNGMVAVNTEDNVYTVYEKNREQQGTFSVKKKGAAWMCGGEDHWYYISEEGITRLTLGNDTKEVIMDGSLGAMGSTVNQVMGAVRGNEDDFYILYYQKKAGTHSLKRYVYDPEAAAVPETTLQVFGLSDSDTVREAAIGFQKKYPDVKVEFTTSGKQAGEVTSDDIRTLNTELLSGNGADVLLLDGLPMNAYIEKGILADLSETAGKIMEADTYLEDILKNTAQKDGKLYGLPIKFGVPILYGNEDAKKALESFDSLKAFLEKDPQASVFGLANREYIRDFLFQIYQDELFGEDGKVDQEKLAELLELAGKIAENAKASLFEENLREDESGYSRDPFTNLGAEGILNHPEGAATASIHSATDMMIPYTVMRQKSLTPETIRGFYQPVGVVGINQNTAQMETAKEFVTYLLSQEVQSAQLDDGFPILESALQDKKDEVNSDYASSFYMMSSWNFEGEKLELEANFPTVEEVEGFIEMCGTLTRPAEQERIIWNLYQEEADQYLGGEIDAETAAENIARKVDTYLAE
ncbi:carbohydrate ABC transporter substrate-binding protein [Lachnospiraceae bacterium]|nr:carbohydrate ABC transporter substrate-binding protein [Lachnospiraceae bacterium]